ncbi:MAG: hydrogenase maturation protease [Candidatus Hydrogenedentes bacterium]|nr:hydrogenase maturation protease [Candidatus Hydrogenedentota bacterium]
MSNEMKQSIAPRTYSPILVIGVGNRVRQDDAAGLVLAEYIRRRNIPGVCVVEHNGEGTSLMDTWRGAHAVIVCDAVRSGDLPGTAYRLDVSETRVSRGFFRYSSHSFGVAEAVQLAQFLGDLPPYFVIFGIEGKEFGYGVSLSEEVADAVEEVAGRITAEIEAIRSRSEFQGASTAA